MQVFEDLKNGHSRRWQALGLALVLGSGFCATNSVAGDGFDSAALRLTQLGSEVHTLNHAIDDVSTSLSGYMPPNAIGGTDTVPVLVAQSRDAALAVRLDQLEEQMRVLNGQVEGLQFQLTQLQTLLERMQADTDARFAAVEGGVALGKTEAVPQSGGALPAGEAPQAIDLSMPSTTQTGTDTDAFNSTNPDDQPIILGAPETPLGTLSLDDLSGITGPEIDIGHAAGLVTDADADAQYRAGYDAVIKGDYDFAEEQFRQFIALFPDHPQAPDATNWLGEALIQRGEYEDAADILLTGFQSYPNAARAPDMLMKLGIAVRGTGENETACRTFTEVLRRFPDVSPAFQQRLSAEMANTGC